MRNLQPLFPKEKLCMLGLPCDFTSSFRKQETHLTALYFVPLLVQFSMPELSPSLSLSSLSDELPVPMLFLLLRVFGRQPKNKHVQSLLQQNYVTPCLLLHNCSKGRIFGVFTWRDYQDEFYLSKCLC